MAGRAKKTNRSKRVDSVRASRDGHQFHEAWVARCALGLLLPRSDLRAIAVEGLSEEDELGAPVAVVEIADATYYYGNGASIETCTRMEVAQFKYSISNADTPLRTYAREMVLWRERRLNAEGKLRAPIYVPPHHEIRGLKPRLRQR